MRSTIIFLLFVTLNFFAAAQTPVTSGTSFQQDFKFFWQQINDEYAYFDKKHTDWQRVKEIYTPLADTITSRDGFVGLLEKAMYDLYDHHAILNTNTGHSRRLIPSGTDVWVEYVKGIPMVTEVRNGFGAEAVGIRAGMEVVAVNDVPVALAVKPFLPVSFQAADSAAQNFALQLLMAGDHLTPRKFTLKYKNGVRDYFPDKTGFMIDQNKPHAMIEAKIIRGTGYIRINDCLYDNGLIPVFDSVMNTMQTTKSLVIDLRNTPGGGTTSVARAILSWFITKDHYYQQHEYPAEEKELGIKRSWTEIVSPRKGKYYSHPLVVLCDHWTGSVGEGIVIGFDALHRPGTKIIGTRMAGLCGAVYTYQMPATGIRFTFPAEKTFQLNGAPREQFRPQVLVDMSNEAAQSQQDIILMKALEYL